MAMYHRGRPIEEWTEEELDEEDDDEAWEKKYFSEEPIQVGETYRAWMVGDPKCFEYLFRIVEKRVLTCGDIIFVAFKQAWPTFDTLRPTPDFVHVEAFTEWGQPYDDIMLSLGGERFELLTERITDQDLLSYLAAARTDPHGF